MSPLRNTGSPPSRGRRIARVVTAIGIAALAGGIATLSACSEAPSAPPGPARATKPSLATSTVHGSPVRVASLRRLTPLAQNVTRSITLYNAGGVLQIPEAGLQVSIPRTALPYSDRPFTITVTALKGDQIAYEFGPSGTRFAAALRVTQDLANTSWAGSTGYSPVEANYFKSTSDLSPSTGTALSYESIPTVMAATGNRLHWDVWHFSGYIVCWGRQ
jgi:hypothetical protein